MGIIRRTLDSRDKQKTRGRMVFPPTFRKNEVVNRSTEPPISLLTQHPKPLHFAFFPAIGPVRPPTSAAFFWLVRVPNTGPVISWTNWNDDFGGDWSHDLGLPIMPKVAVQKWSLFEYLRHIHVQSSEKYWPKERSNTFGDLKRIKKTPRVGFVSGYLCLTIQRNTLINRSDMLCPLFLDAKKSPDVLLGHGTVFHRHHKRPSQQRLCRSSADGFWIRVAFTKPSWLINIEKLVWVRNCNPWVWKKCWLVQFCSIFAQNCLLRVIPTVTFYLAFYAASVLICCLPFFLAFHLAIFVASIPAFNLAFLPTFFLTFDLAYLLTFRLRQCPLRSL